MTTTRDRERLDAVAMKTQRMDNSVAPLTGASEGGGKVVARQLTAAGVTVYVGSRDARRGQAAVDEIGGDGRLLVLDVTGPASITDAARQLGARDVLVNNAGISLDSKQKPSRRRRGDGDPRVEPSPAATVALPVECSSPPTTPATSPARPSAWTEGAFYTPDEASTESNARIPSTTENSETKED